MGSRRRKGESDTLTRDKVQKPRKWKVLIHNDDYTSMEFVVWVLQAIFKHSSAESTRIMLAVHKKGIGVAGVYTRDIAETRCEQVKQLAEEAGHPLQCTTEPE